MTGNSLTPSKIRKGRAIIRKRRKRAQECREAADCIRDRWPLAADELDLKVRYLDDDKDAE